MVSGQIFDHFPFSVTPQPADTNHGCFYYLDHPIPIMDAFIIWTIRLHLDTSHVDPGWVVGTLPRSRGAEGPGEVPGTSQPPSKDQYLGSRLRD